MAQARPDRKPHSSADECLLTVSYVIHCLIIVMEMMMIMMKVMMRTPMNTDRQLSDSANHISAPPKPAWLICQTPLLAWQPNPDFVDLLLGSPSNEIEDGRPNLRHICLDLILEIVLWQILKRADISIWAEKG